MMRKAVENYFHLKALNTNIRTEIVAGLTTFMTMANIIFVNPAMISQMDIFDTVGTLAGVGELGGFMHVGKLPRVGKAMLTDAVGTCVGAACGTPTVTSYIESATGITVGGRSGLTSVITGLLFLIALFFGPLIKMIGGGYQLSAGGLLHPVTAPALIIVGSMMLHSITKID